jgi:hypothetical protein
MAAEEDMSKLEFKYTFKEFFEGTRNSSSVFRMCSLLGGILILYTLYALFKNGTQEGATNSTFSSLPALLIGVFWISLPLLQAGLVWRSNPAVRGTISCWADEVLSDSQAGIHG